MKELTVKAKIMINKRRMIGVSGTWGRLPPIDSGGGTMESVNVKTAITLVCVGTIVIVVCVPLYLGKIKMNCVYGFRIRKAFESEENWHAINKYGAKALMCWGALVMIVGIACLYMDPQSVLTVSKVTFISILAPLGLTIYFARRL